MYFLGSYFNIVQQELGYQARRQEYLHQSDVNDEQFS
jgi:hypothetical protein